MPVDYQTKTILYLEAVLLAEEILSLDEEEGIYVLSDILFDAPDFKLPNGHDDKELGLEIVLAATLYNVMGWDKYDYIECGARASFLMSFESLPLYNPKKTKEILLELEKYEDDELPDEYFLVMGAQCIKGEMFPYDNKKIESIYKVLYDRGDKKAVEHLEGLAKAFGRKNSESSSGKQTSSSTKKSGCYIATSVYGSYDCPEVWVLRRFRDYKLGRNIFGRMFIRAYYAISPTLVKWFGKSKWFKRIWKNKLDKMVTKYKSMGYSDKPYND